MADLAQVSESIDAVNRLVALAVSRATQSVQKQIVAEAELQGDAVKAELIESVVPVAESSAQFIDIIV